jgi:hypothetical protein
VSNYYNIKTAFILLLSLLPGLYVSAGKPAENHSLVESTKLAHYSDITFFVRVPQQPPEPERHVRSVGRSGNAVCGVLAPCTHRTEAYDVKINVADDGRFKWFDKIAVGGASHE